MTERTTAAAASELKQDYQNFIQKAATLFPKVDQKLLMNMLQFEHTYSDWEGNILLKVVYPSGTDMEKKKEWIYGKYQRIPSNEENKTGRFKAIRMYVDGLDRMLSEDPEIEFITGSVTLSPSEAYTA
jgi:hypothetical protein